MFRQLEFRTLLDRLPSTRPPDSRQLNMFAAAPVVAPPQVAPDAVIDTPAKLESLAHRLEEVRQIAFDVETTSTNEMQAELVGIALGFSEDDGVYLPVGHQPDFAGGPQLPLEQVLQAIGPALLRESLDKVGHNLKYDFTVLGRMGVRTAPLAFDTMIAEWLCDPASHNLGLKILAWVRLNRQMTEIEVLIGNGQGSAVDGRSADRRRRALCHRRRLCLPGSQARAGGRAGDRSASGASSRTSRCRWFRCWPIWRAIGVRLDRDFLHHLSAELEARLADLEGEIYRVVGHPFNLNSTQQLLGCSSMSWG